MESTTSSNNGTPVLPSVASMNTSLLRASLPSSLKKKQQVHSKRPIGLPDHFNSRFFTPTPIKKKASNREKGWNDRCCVWENYIPEYDARSIRGDGGRIGQSENYIRRPSTIHGWCNHRTMSTKTSPLLFSNSIGWGRNHYEPDLPHVMPSMASSASTGRLTSIRRVTAMNKVDTTARPPTVHYAANDTVYYNPLGNPRQIDTVLHDAPRPRQRNRGRDLWS